MPNKHQWLYKRRLNNDLLLYHALAGIQFRLRDISATLSRLTSEEDGRLHTPAFFLQGPTRCKSQAFLLMAGELRSVGNRDMTGLVCLDARVRSIACADGDAD